MSGGRSERRIPVHHDQLRRESMALCLTDPGIDESLHATDQVSAVVIVASGYDDRQIWLSIHRSEADAASCRLTPPSQSAEARVVSGSSSSRSPQGPRILPREGKAVGPKKCRQDKVAFVGIEQDPFKCPVHTARIVRDHAGEVHERGASGHREKLLPPLPWRLPDLLNACDGLQPVVEFVDPAVRRQDRLTAGTARRPHAARDCRNRGRSDIFPGADRRCASTGCAT